MTLQGSRIRVSFVECFMGRTVENQFTEISRLVSLFPSGVEPHAPSRDFGRGNAQRAKANDLPIARRKALFE